MRDDRVLQDTKFFTELARGTVQLDDQGLEGRIERFRLKLPPYAGDIEIRFSTWIEGKLRPKPLNISEDRLLELLRSGVANGVFSDRFVNSLRESLAAGPIPPATQP